MADATRPLPSLADPDTAPFWQATKSHELRFQVCDDCDAVVFYPRRHCTSCLGSALSWKVSAGAGEIYSFSVVQLSRHPFFGQKVPYAVALIDLDEGFRILSNVVGVDDPVAQLRVGQRVALEWEDHDEVAIPLFHPA
ncbi:MAG: hypothetical protein DK306_000893 [Chloroflexi bacterium]|jgi:uncharacterized OB-fold protein|nr:MAG: hypothetical protein DK306_000893 [Chloroflexota bacterium]